MKTGTDLFANTCQKAPTFKNSRCVATIKVEWIEPLAAHLCKYSWMEPHWEKKRGLVVAFENVSLPCLT
jgi:HrpA-like RNA helicase